MKTILLDTSIDYGPSALNLLYSILLKEAVSAGKNYVNAMQLDKKAGTKNKKKFGRAAKKTQSKKNTH